MTVMKGEYVRSHSDQEENITLLVEFISMFAQGWWSFDRHLLRMEDW